MPARVNVGVGDLELVTVPYSHSGGRHHGAFLWCSIDQAAHGFVDHGCGALGTMGGVEVEPGDKLGCTVGGT